MQILTWRTSNNEQTWRSTAWRKRTFERLRETLLFRLVSPSLQISLVVLPGCRLASVWVLLFVVFLCFWLWGVVFVRCFVTREIFKQTLPFPAVDRPCLVLVRHCRKKKKRQLPECIPWLLPKNPLSFLSSGSKSSYSSVIPAALYTFFHGAIFLSESSESSHRLAPSQLWFACSDCSSWGVDLLP